MYDIEPSEFIESLAKELKSIGTIKAPEWAVYVKTSHSKERPPVREDWWYVRAASIFRQVMIKGPIGVSKLRVKYGSKKNRGVAAEHFYKGAGNNIRKILQQLEKSELIKQDKKGVHKGRVITPKGLKLMTKVANQLFKLKPKEEEPREEVKKPEVPKKLSSENEKLPKEGLQDSKNLEKGLEMSKTSKKEIQENKNG